MNILLEELLHADWWVSLVHAHQQRKSELVSAVREERKQEEASALTPTGSTFFYF